MTFMFRRGTVVKVLVGLVHLARGALPHSALPHRALHSAPQGALPQRALPQRTFPHRALTTEGPGLTRTRPVRCRKMIFVITRGK